MKKSTKTKSKNSNELFNIIMSGAIDLMLAEIIIYENLTYDSAGVEILPSQKRHDIYSGVSK